MLTFPADNNMAPLYEHAYTELWPSEITRIPADIHINKFSFIPFEWDSSFTADDWAMWCRYFRESWWMPLAVSVVYCYLVFAGQRAMHVKKPMDLRRPLAFWNLFLAIFSVVSCIKVVPFFLYTLCVNGPMYMLTRNAANTHGQGGEVSFWCLMFVFSKYAELIDTVFLVLRKKTVSFLHWYHHATVLLLAVQTMALNGPSGIIMGTMNSIVHSVMYTYYFLAAVLERPPSWSKLVTRLQIAQMIVGSVMAVGLFVIPRFVEYAHSVWINNVSIAAVYLSYLALFLQFYIKRYSAKKVQ